MMVSQDHGDEVLVHTDAEWQPATLQSMNSTRAMVRLENGSFRDVGVDALLFDKPLFIGHLKAPEDQPDDVTIDFEFSYLPSPELSTSAGVVPLVGSSVRKLSWSDNGRSIVALYRQQMNGEAMSALCSFSVSASHEQINYALSDLLSARWGQDVGPDFALQTQHKHTRCALATGRGLDAKTGQREQDLLEIFTFTSQGFLASEASNLH
jgi:hypothetical protein